jgi:PBP1b-binding outer membrane lipoprotein LpoB
MAKTDFKVIDISMKITNQLPMIRITDDLVVTVNNRKNTILNVQAMATEAEKKKDNDNEMEFMTKALEMLIGKESADKIEAMDLPLPEYKEMYNAIMGVATGTYGEEKTPSK